MSDFTDDPSPEELAVFRADMAMKRRGEELANLPKNWDGYGASAPSPDTISALTKSITSNVLVHLVPGSNGSVQAEWHLPGVSIEYCIERDGTFSLSVEVSP